MYESPKWSNTIHIANVFSSELLHSNTTTLSIMAVVHEDKWLLTGLLKQSIKWCIEEMSIEGIYSRDLFFFGFSTKIRHSAN